MSWFKRNTNTATTEDKKSHKYPAIDSAELAYCTAWGKTYTEWSNLTITERRFCRDHVTKAPYFNAEKVGTN